MCARFEVVHHTTTRYSKPVAESANTLRVKPRSNPFQTLESFTLAIEPLVKPRTYTDFYRNTIHYFDIPDPHDSMVFTARSIVTVQGDERPRPTNEPLKTTRQPEYREATADFIGTSTLIEDSPELWRLALDWSAGADTQWQAVLNFCHRVHTEFTYVPGITDVATSVNQAMAIRQGVCQDFAHVMIALCRSIGIPARYVNGYLHGAESESRTEGGATHAWVEVHFDKAGWFGFDPTHDREVDTSYVSVSIGRDYADAKPVFGTYRGTPSRTITVNVVVSAV